MAQDPLFSAKTGRVLHLLHRSQPPGLGPELPQAPLLASAQAMYFEDVKLAVSLTNLIPQAFIKSIYCMLGFVPGAGEVKLMSTHHKEPRPSVATVGQRDRNTPRKPIKNRHLHCAFSNGLKSGTAAGTGKLAQLGRVSAKHRV